VADLVFSDLRNTDYSPFDGRWYVWRAVEGPDAMTPDPVEMYGLALTSEQVWSDIVGPEVEKAELESTSAADLQKRLIAILETQPAIIRLVAEYRPDLLQYVPEASALLQNFSSPDEPIPMPAKRIDGSGTQGTGAVPRAPAVERSGVHGASDLPVHDTQGQGTASSPVDGKTGGDPLVLFTGQMYHQVTDLEVMGRGLHFAFARTYLSQTLYKGPLGYCWDHSYNLWLREERARLADGTLQNTVVRSTGQLREDRYIQILDDSSLDLPSLSVTVDAVFQPPVGFFDRLEKSGGMYILETETGVRFEYNDDLFIGRIVDPNGNQLQFEYTNGILATVRDPVGKEFAFEYDELNRIRRLRDVTGDRSVLYQYGSNGDLEEVDFLFGSELSPGTDYRYLGSDHPVALQHHLHEIIDAAGHSMLECEYGATPASWEYGYVVWQRSAEGEYRYEYGPVVDGDVDPAIDLTNLPMSFTRVFYPNDHSIDHWFNSQGNVVRRLERVLGGGGTVVELVATYRYNHDGLLNRETRPDGAIVEFRYEQEEFADMHGGDLSSATSVERLSFGNLRRRVERPRAGSGETRLIVTEYTWRSDVRRLASQRGPFYADFLLHPLPGQTLGGVEFDYDGAGNLTKITYPDVQLPDDGVQTPEAVEFVYDDQGRLRQVVVGSIRTEYEYFPDPLRSGFVMAKTADASGLHLITTYEFDALGRVSRVIEPCGATTDIQYTPFDAPSLVILPEVKPNTPRPTIAYRYDGNRQLVEVVEELQLHDGSSHPDRALVQRFRRDDYGRLIEQHLGPEADPDAHARIAVLNSSGLTERETDFNGNTTRFRYDQRLLTSSISRAWGLPEEITQRFHYNTSGELVDLEDGRGFRVQVERDGFGRPRTIRDPDGNQFQTEYDASGRVILSRVHGPHPETEQNVRWNETEWRYDAVGRLIETTDHLFVPEQAAPDQLVFTRYIHDPLNRLVAVIDPVGQKWQYQYDGINRQTARRSPAGDETVWRYDDGALTLTILETNVGQDDAGAPLGEVFRRVIQIDKRGFPVMEVDAAGSVTQLQYDSRGLLCRITNREGQEYQTDYDVFGRPTQHKTTVAGSEIRAELTYDSNGNLRSATSPSGGVVVWTYDGLNRAVLVDRVGKVTSYQYDQEGNVIREIDANGIEIKRTYTRSGLLQREEIELSHFVPLPDAPGYKPVPTPASLYRYSPVGNVAVAQYGSSDVLLRYDSLDRVVEDQVQGRIVGFTYDAAGRPIELVYPDDRTISYAYSLSGELVSVVQAFAGFNYPGDPTASDSRPLVDMWRIGGRPIVAHFAAKQRVAFRFDCGKRLVAADWTRIVDNGPIYSERNLYGTRGEWRVHQDDLTARIFEYDELGRLVRVNDHEGIDLIDIASLAPAKSEANLDSVATQLAVDSMVQSLEAAAAASPPVRSFLYTLDENSNRLSTAETIGAGAPTTTNYVPNHFDQYSQVGGVSIVYDRAGNHVADGVNSYRYDGLNRLAQVVAPSGPTEITRDGLGRVIRLGTPEVSRELVYAGHGVVEWRDDGLVAGQVVPLEQPQQYAHLATGGSDFVPLTDRMNSLVGWLHLDGTEAGRSLYDPFGGIVERSPAWPAPFGFAGYRHCGIEDLYQLSARTFHSRLGRFLERDPLGFIDGMNLYAYARHAPGSLVDYWGFASTDINWTTVAAEATKTAAIGGAVIVGGAALVAAGVVSAPFLAVVGGLLLAEGAMTSFFRRSQDAFRAGETDSAGTAALAALGDTVGVTNIIEGAQGKDAVTDRVLGGEERSARLGGGAGSAATVIAGGLLGGRFARFSPGVGGRVNPYTVPSISRPSYYNPIVFGRYVSPQGITLKGNIAPGLRAGAKTLVRSGSLSDAYAATVDSAGSTPAGGRFFHVLRHFHDQPGRLNPAGNPNPHGVFAPWQRRSVVHLLDGAFEASTNPGARNALGFARGQRWIAIVERPGEILGAQLGHPSALGYGSPLNLYTTILESSSLQPVTMFPGWPSNLP
jgi:RHS repeat-associated protein